MPNDPKPARKPNLSDAREAARRGTCCICAGPTRSTTTHYCSRHECDD